jgi:outer membrane protein assembly factor BamB
MSPRSERWSRRGFLATGLATGIASLAGCVGEVQDRLGDAGEGGGAGVEDGDGDSLYDAFSFDDPPALDGWPSRGYSPTNVGWKPNTAGPSDDPAVRWAFDTGTEQPMGSSPAVVDGTAYVGHVDGTVYAVDTASGEARWRFETDETIRWASPTAAGGLVFLGSTDDRFYAIDAATGEARWSHEARTNVTCHPVAVDDRVFFATDAGYVYGFDAPSGGKLWETAEPISGPIQNGLAAADGSVYVSGGRGPLYAFDAATGREQWSVGSTANQTTNGTPTVAGDRILGEFGQYLGVVATDGTDLGGAYRYGVNGWGSPAVAGDRVYVATKGQHPDPTLHALSLRTTEAVARASVEWEATTGRGIFSSPAIVDGTVYVASSTPAVHAFDAETGAEDWTLGVPVADYSSPAIVDGVLYVGGRDGKLYAIE